MRLLVCSGAGYLVTITGMKRMPVTIWVAVRTCLVTAGLLPGFPLAGPMVIVAISWSLRGWWPRVWRIWVSSSRRSRRRTRRD